MITSYNHWLPDHGLVWIEVQVSRGIPVIDIVGLPGSTIKEARERIRCACHNSGLELPKGHILVNLAPASLPKDRVCLDLALACAILGAGEQGGPGVMVLGELTLEGEVRKVDGVLPALLEAMAAGISQAIVPVANLHETAALAGMTIQAVTTLVEARHSIQEFRAHPANPELRAPVGPGSNRKGSTGRPESLVDLEILCTQPLRALGLLAAVAGGHHLAIFGPPGSGKTMGLEFMATLLPDLEPDEFLEVNRLYSLAGICAREGSIQTRAPVRRPHHGSSPESLLGSPNGLPGEISLAHRGLLVLDECGEFRRGLLQALREPMDEGRIHLGRVAVHTVHPAAFQLAVSFNSCPCGNLGRDRGVCLCRPQEIQQYWSRLGGPLLDRMDIRLCTARGSRVETQVGDNARGFLARLGLDHQAASWQERVQLCRARQSGRNPRGSDGLVLRNGELRGIQAGMLEEAGFGDEPGPGSGLDQAPGNGQRPKHPPGLRAVHGLWRLARTLADLEGLTHPGACHLELARSLRQSYEPAPGVFIQD